MKTLSSLCLILTLCPLAFAQTDSFHIEQISPYARAVPGQIIEARVAGLSETPTIMVNPNDVTVELTQDANKLEVRPRTASNTFVSKSPEPATSQGPPDLSKMQALWSMGFVVPKGLHPGEVDVVVVYGQRRTPPSKLIIETRPARPIVGSTTVERISVASLSPAPSGRVNDLGLRLERGAKAQLHVLPLVDPGDPQAAILVTFKQGEQVFEAQATVRHEAGGARQMNPGVRFLRERDFLEVDVPAALESGSAKMAITIRANGETGDAAMMPVLITDATRVAELPAENAPRALVVDPKRVGAGQALSISVDHVRTLNPDPKQAMVMFEQGGVRYTVKPEMNSAVSNPTKDDDSPVFLLARPTRQIIGNAQVRVFNAARGEQGGLSSPTPVEILDEVLAPELISAGESTPAELAHLRQMYEMQRAAGRVFPEFSPENRYLSIRVRGLDVSPRHFQVSLEQDGQETHLGFADYSSLAGELFIVRLPRGLHKGPVVLRVWNKGAERLSEPATTTFELK